MLLAKLPTSTSHMLAENTPWPPTLSALQVLACKSCDYIKNTGPKQLRVCLVHLELSKDTALQHSILQAFCIST